MPGLVAFWDFELTKEGAWIARNDPSVTTLRFPARPRRIGSVQAYRIDQWPFEDAESELRVDRTGPLGHAVRFNQGSIYAAVDRAEFDRTPLDIRGKSPFTMVSWIKFIGRRHMIAGIWDEGGWDRYAGRRQVALFAGLFGRRGVISHISATGAATFPQSTAPGSQYARARAIDAEPFKNNTWICAATTWDPTTGELTAYLNGVAKPLQTTDPVEQSVYQYESPQPANPFQFALPVYSPTAFVMKYNGYDLASDGVSEHRLLVDLNQRTVIYECDGESKQSHRIRFEIRRDEASLLDKQLVFTAEPDRRVHLPDDYQAVWGDEVVTTLETKLPEGWQTVGTPIRRTLQPGAPFTFGRALGLGKENIDHGSQLFIDGVAVFNRVLSPSELSEISFIE